ncbi:MAG TPA: RNA-binding cell elongation regulator Jag/EloR [Acidimicrobiales bacterium]|nr:RNA-binding cell elongation regulator Jag/EloR [Acidimicrobiales bacterium]
MEWVETTGRTVEEAKDAALDQLGVDETDAEFVIVAEPRPGLFGRMRGEARVRARVVPTMPRPKRGRSRRSASDQRRTGGRSGRSNAREGTASVAVVDPADTAEVPDEDVATASPNGSRGGPGSSETPAPRRRRSRGSRGRGGSKTGGSPRSEEAGSGNPGADHGQGRSEKPRSQSSRGGRPRSAGEGKEEAVGEVLSLEEQGESAREFIAGLVGELGLNADVSVRMVDEDTAEVSVDGPELGILIGPGGATLGALQELARTFVQKRTGGHSERILVDVAGYRARRAEALQRFTRQIADEVLSTGTAQSLEPMSAADRKVVHDTVNEISGVETRSEGEDPRRYIVISPSASAGHSGAEANGAVDPSEEAEVADG